jgi:hypothetical protein
MGQMARLVTIFFVDKLLDLSNEDGFVKEKPIEEEEEEEEEEKGLGFWEFSAPYRSFWENLL